MEAQASSSARRDEKKRKIDLHNQVEELKCFNEALLAENEMFERFISRSKEQNQLSSLAPQKDGRGHKKNLGIHSNLSGRRHQLTLEEKLHVSREEIAEAQKDLENLRETNEGTCDAYKASLKEAGLHLEEIRKAKNEFEHKMQERMNDKRLEMKEPEKCLQYLEDKAKAAQVEILRLKNGALKVIENKLKHNFHQKREKGKTSYEEIFQDWGEHKSEKSLDELRANSLEVQRVLTVHKGRFKAENLNQRLRHQMANYVVPGVSEYLQARVKCKRLQQDIHTWERKVRIAQMTAKTSAKAATPACGDVGGPRTAGHQIPVKLPPLPEHRWKGRKLQMLDVIV
ncbi:coiled-coil domain-containing protein 113-like isoform X2 [Takifugu rubripes]|uniref:coiled-coil domain-containing protein 113-like isoform X2 n=1 Tax=Takifugu rubripes TaxID=31033 RepID=UPI0011453B77|nr:coiled-coil domain-containing protein 113-like isoform X2 [Takifugu rubripes]